MNGEILIRNVHAAARGRLDAATLERLIVVAAQDGVIDEGERAALLALDWPADCRARLDEYLAHADAGQVPNPEVAAMRRRDPHFDERLAAFLAHARPGDVVVWRSNQPGPPWNVMRAAYGDWMHVSVVLDDGLLLDPYWPEGVTIATPEAAIAKSFTRIRANAFAITRPRTALDAQAFATFCRDARALLGKPYAFVTALDRPSQASSCSRVAWDLFRAHGLDLAPTAARMYRTAICPGDLAQAPVALVDEDASVTLAPTLAGPPDNPFAKLVIAVDLMMATFPPVRDLMFAFQAPVCWLFMTGMAHWGREVREGFLVEDVPVARQASLLTN